MRLFVTDTSALLRAHILSEPGHDVSTFLLGLPPATLTVSRLVQSEVRASLTRRVAEESIDASVAQAIWNEILETMSDRVEVVMVNEAVHRQAERLLLRPGLRTNDAIHIATALLIQQSLVDGDTVTFVTADGARRTRPRPPDSM